MVSSLLRFAGTSFGGILGMLVWEMTRSNSYGMAVVLFVGFVLLYHVFVSKPMYRVVPMLTAVTMMLVSGLSLSINTKKHLANNQSVSRSFCTRTTLKSVFFKAIGQSMLSLERQVICFMQ